MNNIREIINGERDLNKETLEELAVIAKTSYSTLSRFFNGKTISVDVVERILNHYNLDIVKKFK